MVVFKERRIFPILNLIGALVAILVAICFFIPDETSEENDEGYGVIFFIIGICWLIYSIKRMRRPNTLRIDEEGLNYNGRKVLWGEIKRAQFVGHWHSQFTTTSGGYYEFSLDLYVVYDTVITINYRTLNATTKQLSQAFYDYGKVHLSEHEKMEPKSVF